MLRVRVKISNKNKSRKEFCNPFQVAQIIFRGIFSFIFKTIYNQLLIPIFYINIPLNKYITLTTLFIFNTIHLKWIIATFT